MITFEAKIEHEPSNIITPTSLGQAHNQYSRANAEYGKLGYKVRGTIVTHLDSIDPSAVSSLASIRIIKRNAVIAIWDRVRQILSEYRDGWDLEHLPTRQAAAEQVIAKLPTGGWVTTAIDKPQVWIGGEDLLEGWQK